MSVGLVKPSWKRERSRRLPGSAPARRPAQVGRIGEVELEEAKESRHSRFVDLDLVEKIVEDAARFGVEADVPPPMRVVDRALRPDRHGSAMEVRDPALWHAGQRGQRGLTSLERPGPLVVPGAYSVRVG